MKLKFDFQKIENKKKEKKEKKRKKTRRPELQAVFFLERAARLDKYPALCYNPTMLFKNSLQKIESASKFTYVLGYEEYNGLGIVTFDMETETVTMRTPHGLSWFVTSLEQDNDRSEREALSTLTWPLQDAGVAALVSFGVGYQLPSRRYMLSTEWTRLYPLEAIEIQYGALPGGQLYTIDAPEEGIVATLEAGNAIVFRAVK